MQREHISYVLGPSSHEIGFYHDNNHINPHVTTSHRAKIISLYPSKTPSDNVGIVVFGSDTAIKEGDLVKRTGP
ncbi:hypothetical protein R3W88_006015 [Solanum pinnatisectum]|uniref:ATPase F1/V1/A1 complex alpha/beta subunit N-terminal domain-containing protein n=1 Tax=Solanum pinnatisectum TaxID=50273 RepID=A0AAV9KDS9_9SOLN|nr:hypothetical protein R3W88_006015 [Solanum pinnatisectum]